MADLPHPAGQSRLFVVEEEAAILDGRRLLDLALGQSIDVLPLAGRDIGPEVPWADADLLADVVNAVNSAARVAASDDQSLSDALDRVLNELADEGFPLALDLTDVNEARLDELIDNLRVADGAGNDDSAACIRVGVFGT